MPAKGKRKKRSPIDEFLALPDSEKEKVWESFNREISLSETTPISAAERRQHDRAKRPGRPKKGEGAEPVTLTMERGLLRRTDAFAARTGLTRSQLVATALASVLPKNAQPGGTSATAPEGSPRKRRRAG
jgi:hypothetical protein